MQEERLLVLDLLQNSAISAVDARKILDLLSEEDEKLSADRVKDLRLHCLRWLGIRDVNPGQAIELITCYHKVAREFNEQQLACFYNEVSLIQQIKDAGNMEARLVAQLAKTLQYQNQQDPGGTKHGERMEILKMVHSTKITCTTALDLLNALQPLPVSSSIPGRSASKPASADLQAGHRIREEIRRFVPEKTVSTVTGVISRHMENGDLRQNIRDEVDRMLKSGRNNRVGTTGVPVPRVVGGSTPPPMEVDVTKLADRLHDQIRDLESFCSTIEKEWVQLNQVSAKGSMSVMLQRIRASLGTAHMKMAVLTETRTALELNLPNLPDSSRRFPAELAAYAQTVFTKTELRLRNVELGLIELETIQESL